MALIKCPECEEEISDQAKTCPKCGLDFELKKQIEEIDKKLEKEFQEYVSSLKPPEMISSLSELPRYHNEDSARGLINILGVLGGFCLLGFAFFGMDIKSGFTINHFGVICLSVVPFCIPFYMANYDKQLLKQKQREIQKQIDNFETGKQSKIEGYAAYLEERRSKMIKELMNPKPIVHIPYAPNIPHCPTCGSQKIKRISGISKAGSVAVWGVFAVGRVNKQWHCNHCGSEW